MVLVWGFKQGAGLIAAQCLAPLSYSPQPHLMPFSPDSNSCTLHSSSKWNDLLLGTQHAGYFTKHAASELSLLLQTFLIVFIIYLKFLDDKSISLELKSSDVWNSTASENIFSELLNVKNFNAYLKKICNKCCLCNSCFNQSNIGIYFFLFFFYIVSLEYEGLKKTKKKENNLEITE